MSSGTGTHILREGRQYEVDARTVSTEQVQTSQGSVWDRSQNDYLTILSSASPDVTSISDTTSDTFTSVYSNDGAGGFMYDLQKVPDAATLYGRFTAQFSSGSDTEKAELRPTTREADDWTSATLTELTLSVTSSGNERADSGWTEITSARDWAALNSLEAKVESGGTFSANGFPTPAIAFGWRLD